MQSESNRFARVPWPLVRIAALVVVVMVFGFAGVEMGVRSVGGMLVAFALVQVARRLAGHAASCEVSGQLPVWPALLLAVAQVSVGAVMLGWPGIVLRFMGVEEL